MTFHNTRRAISDFEKHASTTLDNSILKIGKVISAFIGETIDEKEAGLFRKLSAPISPADIRPVHGVNEEPAYLTSGRLVDAQVESIRNLAYLTPSSRLLAVLDGDVILDPSGWSVDGDLLHLHRQPTGYSIRYLVA